MCNAIYCASNVAWGYANGNREWQITFVVYVYIKQIKLESQEILKYVIYHMRELCYIREKRLIYIRRCIRKNLSSINVTVTRRIFASIKFAFSHEYIYCSLILLCHFDEFLTLMIRHSKSSYILSHYIEYYYIYALIYFIRYLASFLKFSLNNIKCNIIKFLHYWI